MKEKKGQETAVVASPEQPMKVEVVERLSDADKAVLDLAKAKMELALEKARTGVALSEAAQGVYNNVILQLALRYGLKDGDKISEDASIQRS